MPFPVLQGSSTAFPGVCVCVQSTCPRTFHAPKTPRISWPNAAKVRHSASRVHTLADPHRRTARPLLEFVLAVSSEANEICEKGSKKTMAPEHIIQALKALGFDKMVEQVQDASDTQKETAKDLKQRKAKKAKGNGMTEEEMIKAQEALFAASRARLESGAPPPPPSATEPKPEPDTQPDV